jgi:glucosamine 6-phosphate synthetase-like amidotransferase/phosphosugar isomerase protein
VEIETGKGVDSAGIATNAMEVLVYISRFGKVEEMMRTSRELDAS